MLPQAIGGVEGEMLVCTQYLFQAWNLVGLERCRRMLLKTGTEETAFFEMLATAVPLTELGCKTESDGRRTKDRSINWKSNFDYKITKPQGEKPKLGPPNPRGYTQKEQRMNGQSAKGL